MLHRLKQLFFSEQIQEGKMYHAHITLRLFYNRKDKMIDEHNLQANKTRSAKAILATIAQHRQDWM